MVTVLLSVERVSSPVMRNWLSAIAIRRLPRSVRMDDAADLRQIARLEYRHGPSEKGSGEEERDGHTPPVEPRLRRQPGIGPQGTDHDHEIANPRGDCDELIGMRRVTGADPDEEPMK